MFVSLCNCIMRMYNAGAKRGVYDYTYLCGLSARQVSFSAHAFCCCCCCLDRTQALKKEKREERRKREWREKRGKRGEREDEDHGGGHLPSVLRRKCEEGDTVGERQFNVFVVETSCDA